MSQLQDSSVSFQASPERTVQARLISATRHDAVFELAPLDAAVRLSEALEDFRLFTSQKPAYAGRAVVRTIIPTGTASLCQVTLDAESWTVSGFSAEELRNGRLTTEFHAFMAAWEKTCWISAEYKIAVSDMTTFLTGLRDWLGQVASGYQGKPDAAALEADVVQKLSVTVLPCIDALFEKFEHVATRVPADQSAAHSRHLRQHLHPLVLCAPFAHRTFFKPLGYAGDFEMVNMISRNEALGDSLFAKLVHLWFVRQSPALAHRNRIRRLEETLLLEILRTTQSKRIARVCNLGCGPAIELQNFLSHQSLGDRAHFQLVDFSDPALKHLDAKLTSIKRDTGRRPRIELIKKSIHSLLRETARSAVIDEGETFDFVYCAGLFDYLSDAICGKIIEHYHRLLAPGGLLVAINVEPNNPLRRGMEHLLDWHLNYRTAAQLLALVPPAVPKDEARVFTDDTGVNVFLEIRKLA